jgi:F-type H+-transporting ATPase subunit a
MATENGTAIKERAMKKNMLPGLVLLECLLASSKTLENALTDVGQLGGPFCNLLGFIPLGEIIGLLSGGKLAHYGGTATGNVWVTGTLAVCTLTMIVVNGLRINGLAYVKHFFMGPFPINILIAVCEIIGLGAKSFALAVRLFANMCAGHILLAVLLSFIAMAGAAGTGVGLAIAVPVVLGSVAIYMLEIFVAFLQAFIFTFLSCVFIGMAVNIHHEDHEESHGHEPEAHEAHAR